MKPEAAELIAIQVLGWLVSNEELLPVFMGATGTSEDDLRQRVGDVEFLGSVLDFITMDDAWVIECCDVIGVSYETPMRARQSLPGGAQMNWT